MGSQEKNQDRLGTREAHSSRLRKDDEEEYYGNGDWDDDMDPDTRRNAMNNMPRKGGWRDR